MTKKKVLSRAFAAILVLCLATAVAVPGFASSTRTLDFPAFEIVAANAGNRALNIERSYAGNLRGTTNVSIYTPTTSDDQNWWHDPKVASTGPILSHVLGPSNELYAINFYRTNPRNCVVYSYYGSPTDSQIYFGGNTFEFTDNGTLYYMTSAANVNNANAYWKPSPGTSLSYWIMR